jgi:glycosyltransferase involved in cell wall biosynthesis
MIPFFSVIVTTYNRAETLPRVISAILDQSFTDFELLIIDDCSTDNTCNSIWQISDPRIRLFKTQVNSGGPALPRNIGINNASAAWLCFCDSDDLFLPDHLSMIYKFISTSMLQDGLISTNAYLMVTNITTHQLYFNKELPSTISFLLNWNSNKTILSTLCIAKKDVIQFRQDKALHSVEDYLFVLDNMVNGKKHYYLQIPSVYYNMASADSLRTYSNTGDMLFKIKAAFFRDNNLWKRKEGVLLASIVVIDFLKFTVKKIINQGVTR